MSAATPALEALDDFDDPRLAPETWSELLRAGDTDVVFLTPQWQRAWWESFERGRLSLLLARRDGRAVALAPLFSDGGMVFFVGSGGSDYLDFVGDVSDGGVLEAILDAARERTAEFVGFRFYHVPDGSRTGTRLRAAAARLGLEVFDEGDLGAPALELHGRPEALAAAVGKKSLVRHERGLSREGTLEVDHASSAESILPRLDAFFVQHVRRWRDAPHPTLFVEPAQRELYRRVVRAAGDAGWLRFTEVRWRERPVAFHFGFHYAGSYMWYKPSFEPDLARRSPGEVLLRQLLVAAGEEGARTFDFGLGEESFKSRFASCCRRVRTWGLYPTGGKRR